MNPPEQSGKTGRINIIIAYFLIYVVWGSTYYFIGVAMKGLPPFLLGAIRFTAAGLMLLAWCYKRNEPIFNKNLIKKSIVSGIVLLFIDMAVVMLAQEYLSSTLVAIIASSTAIWIMVFDAPMWKKNFCNLSIVIGIIIGFIGVLMLYIEQHVSCFLLKYRLRLLMLPICKCRSRLASVLNLPLPKNRLGFRLINYRTSTL